MTLVASKTPIFHHLRACELLGLVAKLLSERFGLIGVSGVVWYVGDFTRL